MNRLTERDEFGNADIVELSDMMPEIYAGLSFSETNKLTDALNRLAAYEDTGLTPEECSKFLRNISELEKKLDKYTHAEADGRLLITPCKIGDMVLDKITDYVFTVERIEFGHKPGTIFRCGNPGTEDYMAFYDWEIGEKIEVLTREEAEAAMGRADNAE